MHPLQHVVNDTDFQGIFFRRVTKQLVGAGGLWQESSKMYNPFKPHSRTKPEMQRIFPNGGLLSFSHMEHEKNRHDHQGLQYSFVGFDELTHFAECQFTYLLSRLRSDSDVKSYAMATCNPDPDSWVFKWIEWWLDEDGYPDPSKQGALRHYIIIDDQPIFADTAEELMEKYPENCRAYNPKDKKYVQIIPKTITFIGGTIFDNPILIEKNPNYLAELKSLPDIERARLLDGNWKVRAKGSNYWSRSWLGKRDYAPKGGVAARGWDKASQEPSQVERQPDFTASVKMIKTQDGRYTILGDYTEDNRDTGDTEIYGKFRKRAGERDRIIQKQGEYDGEECIVVLPVDPGAAGKVEFQEASKKRLEAGLIPKADPAPATKSKLIKFTPFAVACENGLVDIVESSFRDRKSLEAFYKELEAFNGERSSRVRKDDLADCSATAFNFLAKETVIPSFSLGASSSPTRIGEMIGQVSNKQTPIL